MTAIEDDAVGLSGRSAAEAGVATDGAADDAAAAAAAAGKASTAADGAVTADETTGGAADGAADRTADGAARPGDGADADADAGPGRPGEAAQDDEDPAGATARRGRPLLLPAVLAVAALAVAALGVWCTAQADAARDEPAARNTALVDTGTTAEVNAAVTNALNQVFSYSYDKPEVTERAAAEVLRGPALTTYDQLFAQVRDLAPQQRIVLTTRVVHSAVQSITGDRAQLLVFLDQSATRVDDATTSSGAAQLSVTAERQGETWLIIDLTPR